MTADPSLVAEMRLFGRFDASCLNCGGCSLVCELSAEDVTFPRRPIHRVLVGARSAALAGIEPWLCHDCGDCTVTCPRQAEPADSMNTLRRWLTAQYDGTGLASLLLRSRAWHYGSLFFVGLLVVALAAWYHLSHLGLALRDAASMPMGMEHMFPTILYFTWVVYALPALLVAWQVRRMYRLTIASARIPLHHFLRHAGLVAVEMATQKEIRKCPTERARAPDWWREPEFGPPVFSVPRRRWLAHWLMAFGTVLMAVLTVGLLRWFQTDAVHPPWHAQRWLGYLATAFILFGTSEVLLRRLREPRRGRPRRNLTLPGMLWLAAATGITLHVLRVAGLPLAAHYAYAVHLAVCVSVLVVEVPFGGWAHMIHRPIAMYLQAVRRSANVERRERAGAVPAAA